MTQGHRAEDWHIAELRGAHLHWAERGSGSTIVCAHALSTDGTGLENAGMLDWSPVTRSHRLVRYDARGHGRSSGGTTPSEYSFASFAEDLLALLDTVAPGQTVSGIGTSLGTATLLHAATIAPDRFDRLVLAAPGTAWSDRAGQASVYSATAALIERDGLAAFTTMLDNAPRPPIFAALPGYPPRTAVTEARMPALLRGIGSSDLPPAQVVSDIAARVLLLAWPGDPVHPVATAERLTELIPNAELRIAQSLEDMASWGELAATFLR